MIQLVLTINHNGWMEKITKVWDVILKYKK